MNDNNNKTSFIVDDSDAPVPGNPAETDNMPHLAPSPKGRWNLLSENYDTLSNTNNNSEQAKVSPVVDKKAMLFEKPERLKYRCEQLTITKVNGIIENHAETKSEFQIRKVFENNTPMIAVELTDSVTTVYPENLREGFKLVADIDELKNNVTLSVNQETGKPLNVVNITDIENAWITHRKKLEDQYAFVQSDETRKNIQTFLEMMQKGMTNEGLLQYYATQPFYDLFFGKYLLSDKIDLYSGNKIYYSQLFDLLPVEMKIDSKIKFETPDTITVAINSDRTADIKTTTQIELLYDQRFKSFIGYKFSDYIYHHNTEYTVDKTTNVLENAVINIHEAVKNNIEVIVEYKLRRIEL